MSEKAAGDPLDDIRNLLRMIPQEDKEAIAAVRARDKQLTKPAGSLGKLEELVEWLAAWQGDPKPIITRPLVTIFAANHGVADKGVSAFPQSVTQSMVENFAAGGAAINQLCLAHDLGLKIFDLALEVPTPDVSEEDAFDAAGCAATLAFGMEAIAGGTDLLCIGEMGIANTTVASILFNALYGGDASDWVGPGTGIDNDTMKIKADVVTAAVKRIGGPVSTSGLSGLELLRRVGGREIAAMCGAILAARHQRIPVIIDGFVATASAAILHAERADAIDHCLFGHRSAEPAHDAALKKLGKEPLLDLGMRLGEGSGAAIAAGIVKAAAKTHADMATFEQAGVATS
ncbi:MAG: nicotinate-nucleotide--dimethylbenzimidazole phosphoribosyltransferase [Hyphomicrobiales bacterium]